MTFQIVPNCLFGSRPYGGAFFCHIANKFLCIMVLYDYFEIGS